MVKGDILPEKKNALPLISVIVPCYNAEDYIDECIESIVNQTFKNFEIILVDDGSTDNTAVCIRKWLEHKNIKYFWQSNKGLCEARNRGVKEALGELICFTDNDDIIHPEFLEKLYSAKTTTGADIAFCNFRFFSDKVEPFNGNQNNRPVAIYSTEEMLKNICIPGKVEYIVVWNKLYPKKFLLNTPFPRGKIFDDEFTMHHIIGQAERIVEVEAKLYFYRQRGGSIINSNYSDEKFMHALEAFKDRKRYFINKDINTKSVDRRIWHYVWNIWLQKKNALAKKTILSNPVAFIRYAPPGKKQSLKEYLKILRWHL